MIISVFCPICGHHLVGYGYEEKNVLKITAYCPLCDNEYMFKENKN